MDDSTKLALETIKMNKQAIVFCPSRASAEKAAEEISKLTNLHEPALEESVLKAASGVTKQCRRLSNIIKKGIAFHHAGLLQKQKEIIEDNFRAGKVKIICATPTLAAGLSMPAFRVILKSLKRYSGNWGMNWIPVLEYLQMAGRAGRPEYEKIGESIAIAKNEAEKQEIYETYVCGVPEDIYSKLAVEPVLRTYLLSLISSGIIRDRISMHDFFQKTFWAFQFDDLPKLEAIMEKMLLLLEEWKFITLTESKGKDNFVSASDISNLSNTKNTNETQMRATMIGKRVSELYLDPLTARHLLDCLENFTEEKGPFSILHMISNTLEMRPLLRVKSKEQDLIQDELVKRYNVLLQNEPSAYDVDYPEFINSIKTALFLEAWTNEKDEEFLLETYNVRPGEIRYKLESADWLLYAAEELAHLSNQQAVRSELRKLRLRVKHGVKEELLSLLKLKGIGRIRARKLYLQGIRDMGNIKTSDATTLAQILGRNTAISVKKQVGEEIKEIPKGTRKGQLSLEKY